MKRIFTLMLAFVMLFSICGCKGDVNDNSSQEVVYEHQQIIVDADGNTVTSLPENTTSSNEEDTNNSTPDTSSDVTGNKKPINIDYNKTVEVDICDDIIRGYLDADTVAKQFDWLNQYSGTRHDSQGISLDWHLDASFTYTVTFSENADFSNAHTIEAKFTDVKDTILIPGKTYYWKVTGTWSDEVLGVGKIHVKDAPVRWVGIDGVGNVRDMGGWKAENGKTVKYGMLYRGQKLESVTEKGIATIKQLGLKTELDIRYASQKFQTPGTGMNYEFIESPGQYDAVMKNDPEVFKASYKRIFELLADKNNYPFYAHCNAGADRTGTYAFIVNGVLGVSYEDLTRDFELTSFSSSGKRWRGAGTGNTFGENDLVMQEDSSNTVAWGRLHKEMMAYGAKGGYTTLQESIEYWLTNYIGVPKEHIDSFKSIVLE